MILISAGLVLTAIVLLIAGFVMSQPFLVMWSIAVSVLSAVFLVIGALLRRHELFPAGGRGGAAPPPPPRGSVPPGPPVPNQPVMRTPPPTVPHGVRQTVPVAPQQGPGRTAAARRGHLGDDAIVLVIPGRKRYHVAGCRQLAGRDHEELTHEEAREEGFTPCTTCLPEFTGGLQQGAPPEIREPVSPSPRGPGSSDRADAAEAGVRDPAGLASHAAVPPDVRDTPVTRPYVQSPSAPAEQTRRTEPEPGPAQPPSAGQPDRPQTEERVVPPRTAEAPAHPQPSQAPAPGPEKTEDSGEAEDPNATSWFSRDIVRHLVPDDASAESKEPATGQEKKGVPAEAGDREAAEAQKEPAEPARKTTSPAKAAEPSQTESAPVKPASTEPAVTKPADAGQAPAEGTKPVEPAETGPGRAGRPVPVGSTSAAPEQVAVPESPAKPEAQAPDAKETGEGGAAPEKKPDAGEPEMVKIIVGTRRFHSPTCPLIRGLDAIKGVEGSGLETISLADAEAAGMRSCSVCRPIT
ncbi:hypothetical protein [Streptosporangium sp. NPDC020145]|uniref:Uncharacterized protein n=1 Tax=Streptosporangium jomthongense TaxID=1193683 RepID=A0ABV8EZP1_9ACTN